VLLKPPYFLIRARLISERCNEHLIQGSIPHGSPPSFPRIVARDGRKPDVLAA
jgi:hypothetical protein